MVFVIAILRKCARRDECQAGYKCGCKKKAFHGVTLHTVTRLQSEEAFKQRAVTAWVRTARNLLKNSDKLCDLLPEGFHRIAVCSSPRWDEGRNARNREQNRRNGDQDSRANACGGPVSESFIREPSQSNPDHETRAD